MRDAGGSGRAWSHLLLATAFVTTFGSACGGPRLQGLTLDGKRPFAEGDLLPGSGNGSAQPNRPKKARADCVVKATDSIPIFRQEPTEANGQAIWGRLQRPGLLCFGYTTGYLAEADDSRFPDPSSTNPSGDVQLLLMPEKRLLTFDPDSLAPGTGAIVAIVENWDSGSDLRLSKFNGGSVRQAEEAYLFYGKRQDSTPYAVLFKFVKDQPGRPKLVPIAEGTWRVRPHDYPEAPPENTKRLMARWEPFHPILSGAATASAADSAADTAAPGPPPPLIGGPGWISCLRGCCPAGSIFQ